MHQAQISKKRLQRMKKKGGEDASVDDFFSTFFAGGYHAVYWQIFLYSHDYYAAARDKLVVPIFANLGPGGTAANQKSVAVSVTGSVLA